MKKLTVTLALTATAAAVALATGPAQAAPAVPFPVHVATTGVLTTAHAVTRGERLMVGGKLVILGQVDHPGPYVAHTIGLLPKADVGRDFPAIRVG